MSWCSFVCSVHGCLCCGDHTFCFYNNTYYCSSTDSVYVKFVGYDLKVPHHRTYVQIFHREYLGMIIIWVPDFTYLVQLAHYLSALNRKLKTIFAFPPYFYFTKNSLGIITYLSRLSWRNRKLNVSVIVPSSQVRLLFTLLPWHLVFTNQTIRLHISAVISLWIQICE